jgi:5-methylcytosine-specific restriction endonuclease McrA
MQMKSNCKAWWIKRKQYERQSKNERFYLNRERNQRFYQSRKWYDLRSYKLALNSLCEICSSTGLIEVAVEIHHTVNINTNEGWQNRFNVDGLMSLCKSCHSKQTVQETTMRKEVEKRERINIEMTKLEDFI